jgi:hypothetical protein
MLRDLIAGVAGSVAVAWLLSGASAFGQLQGPPPGWTFTFAQGQPIGGNTPVTEDNGLFKAPVRTPLGSSAGYFVRIEMRNGERPVGIVTLNDRYRTVAIPLERLRFNPAGREVLTDMNWMQVVTMPSGALDRQYARLTGNLTR